MTPKLIEYILPFGHLGAHIGDQYEIHVVECHLRIRECRSGSKCAQRTITDIESAEGVDSDARYHDIVHGAT